MADKNIQMSQRNAANTAWDNLHPITKASNVKTNSGSDVEAELAQRVSKTDLAKTTSGSSGAKSIGVSTISGLLGNDIQTVLQSLFQYANDGKTAVANAITAKGVTASSSDTFSALAAKIGQINTGKKWASGVSSATSSLSTFKLYNDTTLTRYYLQITGLDFKPGFVIAFDPSRAYANIFITVARSDISMSSTNTECKVLQITSASSVNMLRLDGEAAYMIFGGFRIPMTTVASANVNSIAFEE